MKTARKPYQPSLFDEPTPAGDSRTLQQATAQREAVLRQLRHCQTRGNGSVSGMLLRELSSDWQTDVAELRRLGHEIEIDVYDERFFLARLK